jgi:hypothetical protein
MVDRTTAEATIGTARALAVQFRGKWFELATKEAQQEVRQLLPTHYPLSLLHALLKNIV